MLMVRSFCGTRIAQRRADADDAWLFRHQVLHRGSRMLMMRSFCATRIAHRLADADDAHFLQDQDSTEAS